MNFTLYSIYDLAREGLDLEGFDRHLPCDIAQDVRIEDVSALIRANAFDIFKEKMGTDDVEKLGYVRHALIHRLIHGPNLKSAQSD